MRRSISTILLLGFGILFFIVPDVARAAKFGKVTVDSVPLYETHESTRRGYAGYLFLVKNEDNKPHVVQVKIPAEDARPYTSSLVSDTRTLKLAAGQTAHLWIYQPAILMTSSLAMVTIDGRAFRDRLVEIDGNHESLYEDAASYSASYTSPIPSAMRRSGTTSPELVVEEGTDESQKNTTDKTEATEEDEIVEAIDKEQAQPPAVEDAVEKMDMDDPGMGDVDPADPMMGGGMGSPEEMGMGMGGGMGMPGMGMGPMVAEHSDATIGVLTSRGLSGNLRQQIQDYLFNCNMVRSAQKTSQWPTNWIAYSRFDGIILSEEEFSTLPAETVTALADYASVGGVVWVRPGKNASVSNTPEIQKLRQAASVGLGTFLTGKRDGRSFKEETIEQIQRVNAWDSASSVAKTVPALERSATPVRLFLVLLIFYALLIGPALQFFLKRKRRRIWMLWIIPVTSVLLCVAVFIGSYLSEGFHGFANFRNITILDQTTGRASTVGWASFYSPLSDGAGLKFSTATVLQPQWANQRWNDEEQHQVAIDWTSGQHLTSGWLQAKTPLAFRLWKAEPRREKLTIRKDESGKVTATNALGADLVGLKLHMPDGAWYAAEKIAAGETSPLQKTGEPKYASLPTVKEYCRNASNWSLMDHNTPDKERAQFEPGTYQAMVEGHPFVNTAITDPAADKGKTLVFGRFVVE